MIKLTVKNLQNETVASAKFQSLELAEAYVASQTSAQSVCLWGKLASVERLPVVDGDGNPVLSQEGLPTYSETNHPQEFTVEYNDVGNSEKLEELKEKAFQALRETDWTQLADSGLSAADKKVFDDYRKAIKDEFKKADVTKIALPETVKVEKFKA